MMYYLNPRNWPILFKISVALLGASLVPAIIIALYGLSYSMGMIEQSEYRNLRLLASATAERLDQLMQDNVIAASQLGSINEILMFISDPTAPADVREDVGKTLDRLLITNPQYEFVYLMNAKGDVLISRQLPSVKTVEGQNFATRAYFIEAMKGKPYIDVLVGRTTKKLGFYFSAPILDAKNQPVGVAIIKLQGEAITGIINRFKSGNSGYAFLVDQDGVIVSHPNDKWYYHSLVPLSRETELKVGQRFLLPGCEDAKKLENCKVASLNLGTLSTTVSASSDLRNATYTLPSDGSGRIVGLANTTTQLNWTVGVDESRQDFTTPLNLLAQQTLFGVLVVGFLAIIFGIILARLITRPIDNLSLAALAVEKGNPIASDDFSRVLRQGDEVGHLANVFNNMVGALNARVSEMHVINLVSRQMSSSFNIGNTLPLVLNSLRNVVPYDRALVLLFDDKKNEFQTRATADGRGFFMNRVWNHDDRPNIHNLEELHIKRFLDLQDSPRLTAGGGQSKSVLIPNLTMLPDTGNDYASEWSDFTPMSYLGVPLLFKDEIIGLIELASGTPGAFNSDHERVLELLAGQAAVAVHNALDVENRENELRRQIDELQIVIDEGKKQKSVNEIVESDFFQELTSKAQQIRQKRTR